MKALMSILAIIALGLTVIPSVLVFNEVITLDVHKKLMAGGALLWFVTAPIWFKKSKS
jgi:hypothetical protein